MAGRFGMEVEEEDVLAPKEPQVTSQDPEERKAARALRIKRRHEAIKRAEQPPEEISAEEEPDLIEIAAANAAEELQKLSLEGITKVTNVKITTDEREVIRRNNLIDKMRHNLEKIEEEANEAQTQYEAITANWDVMLKTKDPLDIDVAIQGQRVQCDLLLAQKNMLIDELKDDLKNMDQAYYDDLDKQDREIKELSDRLEKQITTMQRAYVKQLELIEEAICIERETLVEHNNKRWEALYKQRDKEELMHMDYKEERLEEHKQEVESIMWDHYEKYREAKIELETLIQELQKELEKLKATCIINTEKIGYTYQVLKKREEENIFVRSAQKRKLNKMMDAANKLRAKIRKAAEDGAIEEMKADAEIVKLMQAMDDLEKKSYQFSQVNDYKFTQVWRMSSAKCVEMARSLRRVEVAIHAQVLSEPPPPPPPPPPKSPLRALPDQEESGQADAAAVRASVVDPNDPSTADAKQRLIRHLLALVADNTGFLVEDRLLQLLEKYPINSRNLCTLDSIFMALEIQAEEDIELLLKTFLKYAFCPVCVGLDIASELLDPQNYAGDTSQDDARSSIKSGKGDRVSLRARSSVARSMSISTTKSGHVGLRGHELTPSDQQLMLEADEIMQKCGDPGVGQVCGWQGGGGSEGAGGGARRAGGRGVTVASQPTLVEPETYTYNPYLCSAGHPLEIEPMQVLSALGEFIAVFEPPDKRKLYDLLDSVKPPDFSTATRQLKPEDMEAYWAQWRNVFPPDKHRFWDGLLAGLHQYLPILQERERVHEEVVALRRRNAELRRLVRGALPALPPAAPPALPKYLRAAPPAFTAPAMDQAKLPPI